MAEDLTRLWGNLSLDEGEIEEVEIQPRSVEGVVSRGKSCLVGKLLSDRYVGKDIIKRKLIKGWRPSGHLAFKVLGENLFLLEFENEWDKIRVLEGRPWIFEGILFSVEDFDGLSSPSEIDFEHAVFWVRMHNLPLACMGKEVGVQIGATIGLVEEVDTDVEGVGWGEYLRVRIRIDLTKPLARGRVIKLLGKQTLIAFQYEKLPKYCYDCGKICHGRGGCTIKGGARINESEKQYGPWLRVPSPRRRGEFSNPRPFDWQGMGSRTSANSGGAPPSQAEEIQKMKSPAASKPVRDDTTVMDEESNYGDGGETGENIGVFTAGISVTEKGRSSAVLENNNGMEEEQLLVGNILHEVRELKLKGKGVGPHIKGSNCNGAEVGEKSDSHVRKRQSATHQFQVVVPPVNANEVPEDYTRGGNINKVSSVGGTTKPDVAQTWKRRARANQNLLAVSTPTASKGKRKTIESQGEGTDETCLRIVRRLKYNGENAFVLRDEDEEKNNGSGVAGSGSQPRRPT